MYVCVCVCSFRGGCDLVNQFHIIIVFFFFQFHIIIIFDIFRSKIFSDQICILRSELFCFNYRQHQLVIYGHWATLVNMATAAIDFGPWLIQKLTALQIDEGVYGSYITGILEGDESADEKKEALEGILSEIVVSSNIL